MTVVGWILFLIRSLARLSSSAATRTTDVVPSPTSLSCCWASSTRMRPAGWSTSIRLRIVAPSFEIVTSCACARQLHSFHAAPPLLATFPPLPSPLVESCTYSDIINHHLVKSRRTKTASNDVGNSHSRCLAVSWRPSEFMEGRTRHVLLANLSSRHALSSTLQNYKSAARSRSSAPPLEKDARAAGRGHRQLQSSTQAKRRTHHLRPRVFVEESHR